MQRVRGEGGERGGDRVTCHLPTKHGPCDLPRGHKGECERMVEIPRLTYDARSLGNR